MIKLSYDMSKIIRDKKISLKISLDFKNLIFFLHFWPAISHLLIYFHQ